MFRRVQVGGAMLAALATVFAGCAGPQRPTQPPASIRSLAPLPTDRPIVSPNSSAARIEVPASVDATGSTDASAALQRFVDGVPNGSTIVFKAGGTYRMDHGLVLGNRHDLVFEGNGATLLANGSGGTLSDSIFALMYGDARIAIRDFTLLGNNPDAGTKDAFHGGAEHLAGVFLGGSTDIEISGVTMRGFYGDCVNIGTNTTDAWSERVIYQDSTCTGPGRHGVAVVAARDVTIRRVRFDQVGMMVVDIEPDRASEGATGIMIRDNTIGSYGLTDEYVCWVVAAYAGASGAPIQGVTLTGNTISGNPSAGYNGRALGLNVVVDGTIGPRSDFIVRDNTSTITVVDPPPIDIGHTDGVTVTGNRQPMRSGSLAIFRGSSDVIYQGNDTNP